MAVSGHFQALLDRLSDGKPAEGDHNYTFAKLKDASVVGYLGTSYPGNHVQVFIRVDGQWFAGPQLDRFPDSAGKLLKRGPSLQARQQAWAKEKEREERDGRTAAAKQQRTEWMAELDVVHRELEGLKQVGGDRDRIAELTQEEDTLCRWIWPARYGAPTVADHAARERRRAHPAVDVL